MRKAVISPTVFEEEVRKLVIDKKSEAFQPRYEYIDTDVFIKLYLDRFSEYDVLMLLAKRNIAKSAIKRFRGDYLLGSACKIGNRIAKRYYKAT